MPRSAAAQLHSTLSYFVYPTPFGPITVGATPDAVRAVALGETPMDGQRRPTEVSNACSTQLLEYFAGKRRAFDVPVKLEGSAFQLKVWQAVANIPYGQTRTSQQIAEAIGQPASFRMVGAAVKKNPLAVIIPAHRVVGANGKPAGADHSSRLRAAFLELERRHA